MARAQKEDYNTAIADFNESIRIDPNNASAFINRGNACASSARSKRHSSTTKKPSESIRKMLTPTTIVA